MLSAALGLSAVAYDSAPDAVIMRSWLVPAALTAVIFRSPTSHLISRAAAGAAPLPLESQVHHSHDLPSGAVAGGAGTRMARPGWLSRRIRA